MLPVLPFITAQLRYGLLVATGEAESPERALLADRLLLGAGLAWAALLAGGLYLA